jgi:hypothetical protein
LQHAFNPEFHAVDTGIPLFHPGSTREPFFFRIRTGSRARPRYAIKASPPRRPNMRAVDESVPVAKNPTPAVTPNFI